MIVNGKYAYHKYGYVGKSRYCEHCARVLAPATGTIYDGLDTYYVDGANVARCSVCNNRARYL